MKIPLISVIFQGIPENIAVVALIFLFARINLRWREIIVLGTILALTAYIIRLFPITFGIHTIVLMGLIFMYLTYHHQAPLLLSLRACLIGYLILIIVEYVCFTFLSTLLNISFELYLDDVTIRTLIGLPQVIVLFIIIVIIQKYKGRKTI